MLWPFPLPKPTQRAFLLQQNRRSERGNKAELRGVGGGFPLEVDIFNERQENVQHRAELHGFKVTNHLLRQKYKPNIRGS